MRQTATKAGNRAEPSETRPDLPDCEPFRLTGDDAAARIRCADRRAALGGGVAGAEAGGLEFMRRTVKLSVPSEVVTPA